MRNKKMKWTIVVTLFLVGLAITLLPVKKSNYPFGAFAENLWTNEGQWKKKIPGSGWGEWIRREHGIGWNWFVLDIDTKSDARQARLDAFCLAFYVFVASVLPVGFLVFERIVTNRRM